VGGWVEESCACNHRCLWYPASLLLKLSLAIHNNNPSWIAYPRPPDYIAGLRCSLVLPATAAPQPRRPVTTDSSGAGRCTAAVARVPDQYPSCMPAKQAHPHRRQEGSQYSLARCPVSTHGRRCLLSAPGWGKASISAAYDSALPCQVQRRTPLNLNTRQANT